MIGGYFCVPAPTENEDARLAAIEALGIRFDVPDPVLDMIVAEAAAVMATPIALISIVHRDHQQFRARIGLTASQTPRDLSFCGHALHQPDPFVIEDARDDQCFAGNPLVVGEPFIRFYAGVPLLIRPTIALGTLCVIDTRPRKPTEQNIAKLVELTRRAVVQLEKLRMPN